MKQVNASLKVDLNLQGNVAVIYEPKCLGILLIYGYVYKNAMLSNYEKWPLVSLGPVRIDMASSLFATPPVGA